MEKRNLVIVGLVVLVVAAVYFYLGNAEVVFENTLTSEGLDSGFSAIAFAEVDPNNGGCFEEWGCGGWTECVAGLHSRDCYDLNHCNTFEDKPELEEECTVPEVDATEGNEVGEIVTEENDAPRTDVQKKRIVVALSFLAFSIILVGAAVIYALLKIRKGEERVKIDKENLTRKLNKV